jgi:hypothetical protein
VQRSTFLISKRKPLRLGAGAARFLLRFLSYLLPVGQLLEIIFTFCTVNVGCDPEEEPAPVALDALLELGELPLLEAELLLSVPVTRI